ncbi:MAG: hypothetical protein ACMXYA_03055 [Candidatus Woesearchaeota archaeon]
MKKRGLFWISILLICLIPLYADTILYQTYFTSGDQMQFGQNLYDISIDVTGQQVRLLKRGGGESFLIQRGGNVDAGNYNIAFLHSQNFTDSQGNRYYEALLQLTHLEPQISYSWVFEEISDYIFEPFEIQFRVENTGSRTANDVRFSHSFPNVKFTRVSGCEVEDSTVFFMQDLEPDKEITCRYRFEPQREFLNQQLFSSLTFMYEEQETRIFPSSLTITAFAPIVFDIAFNTSSIRIGEDFMLNITAINIYDSRLDSISYDLFIPRSIITQYIDGSFEKVETNVDQYDAASHTFSLNRFQNKSFSFVFQARSQEVFPFFQRYSYTFKNHLVETDLQNLFVLSTTDDNTSLETNHSDAFEFEYNITSNMTSFQELDIDFAFRNRNDVNYSNVTVQVLFDNELLFEQSRFVQALFLIRVPTIKFRVPSVMEEQEKQFQIRLQYMYDNQNYTYINFHNVTVHPVYPIDIRHNISHTNATVSEIINVSVYASSTQPGRSFQYEFREIIPPEFIVRGQTQRNVTLRQDVESLIYSYQLIPRDIQNETLFDITTLASTSYLFDTGDTVDISLQNTTQILVTPFSNELLFTFAFDDVAQKLIPYQKRFFFHNNGSRPISDLEIRPVPTENMDVSSKIFRSSIIVPGETQSESFFFRALDNESLVPTIMFSYRTPENVLITRYEELGNISVESSDMIDSIQTPFIEARVYWDGNYYYSVTEYINKTIINFDTQEPIIFGQNSSEIVTNAFFTYSFLTHEFHRAVPIRYMQFQEPELVDETAISINDTLVDNESLTDIQEDDSPVVVHVLIAISISLIIGIILLIIVTLVTKKPVTVSQFSEQKSVKPNKEKTPVSLVQTTQKIITSIPQKSIQKKPLQQTESSYKIRSTKEQLAHTKSLISSLKNAQK